MYLLFLYIYIINTNLDLYLQIFGVKLIEVQTYY